MQGEPGVQRKETSPKTRASAIPHLSGLTPRGRTPPPEHDSIHSVAGAAPNPLTLMGSRRREGHHSQHPINLYPATSHRVTNPSQQLGHHHLSLERRHRGHPARQQPQPSHGDHVRPD